MHDEVFKGTAGAVVLMREWAATSIAEGSMAAGDTRAMDSFRETSMSGDYGVVMQAASESGEYWADTGIIGGLEEFGSELSDFLFD